MHIFIIAFLSIALISALYATGIMYGNPAKVREVIYIEETTLAISTLVTSANTFRTGRGIDIRESQWQQDIQSVSHLPTLSFNHNIYYKRDGINNYFCISTTPTGEAEGAFNNIVERDLSGNYSRDNHCDIEDGNNKSIISYSF